MAKRLWVYVSKTDVAETFAMIGEQADARTQADAALGLVNWQEWDFTPRVLPMFGNLVNLARERAQTLDGTGRWRWRTVANVVKRWLGEPVEENCESCGQRWPS
jgi:hypothetical protein